MGIGSWFKHHLPKIPRIKPPHIPHPPHIDPPHIPHPPHVNPPHISPPHIPGIDSIVKDITTPYNQLNHYVKETEALGKSLSNGAVSELKVVAMGAYNASKGAVTSISHDAENIGQRLAHATQGELMKVAELATKLENELPSLKPASIASIGDKLKSEASNLETGHLSKLYDLINDASNTKYNDDLKAVLTEISSTAGDVSSDLHIPISNLTSEVIDKISTILPKLPEQATHLIAGMLKLDELEKALSILKQVQSDKKVINVEKKTLIVSSAALSASAKVLKAAGTILPMTVAAEGEAGVGANEKGGAGAAAGVRAGGEVAAEEEGNVGGGSTLVKVGKFICNLLAIILKGIATLLDQLQLHIPVKQGA